MKIFTFLILLVVVPMISEASVPRVCNAKVAEIHETLLALAVSAKRYAAIHGEIPGVWSHGMADIIQNTPETRKVGGNINPRIDKNSMEITCANNEFEPTIYTTYSINLSTHLVKVSELRVTR